MQQVPTPELGPGEAVVAVMASSVNFNTVWTSIFEPVSTFGFLERYGRLNDLTKRHDLPYHVVGLRPGRRRAGRRAGGEQVEGRRRGRRALPERRARGRRGPRRHDDGPAAADLGVRDQLRRPGRPRAGQEQPADAQGPAPDLGGGRRPRAGQLHRLPPAGQQERRRDEAGRHRPGLGRQRRAGLLRHPVRAQRRRHPGLRRQQPREGRHRPQHGRRARHRPQRRGLPVLEGRAHPGPQGVAAVRQRGSASSPAARTSTSSSSTPAGRPSAPRSTSPGRAARSPPAPPPAATCTSTTTGTSG